MFPREDIALMVMLSPGIQACRGKFQPGYLARGALRIADWIAKHEFDFTAATFFGDYLKNRIGDATDAELNWVNLEFQRHYDSELERQFRADVEVVFKQEREKYEAQLKSLRKAYHAVLPFIAGKESA